MLAETAAALIYYPLAMALAVAIIPSRNEKFLSRIIYTANFLNSLLTAAFVFFFAYGKWQPHEFSRQLFATSAHSFNLTLLVDAYSVSFTTLIGVLSGLILLFSRRYMHRESGYRRFFALIFLFMCGIKLVALAGTIDMLFAGWEIVGVSSFLLIGFYRTRLQPGRNALRTYTIYRFCDIGLFMSAWLTHKLGSELRFFELASSPLDTAFITTHSWFFVAIAMLTLVAAMGKSAQYPFSFWVPRAMEGPTPSSAIFYGALSIHAGVFLLIRMYPIWKTVLFMPYLVGGVGLTTALVANIAQKTQSNIKGQIGYASVAQVGLMFFELALGQRELAMAHFLGNAALRCYQLLASPSVVVLYLRQQAAGTLLRSGFSNFIVRHLGARLHRHYFAFSFSEGYSESILTALWSTLKSFSRGIAYVLKPYVVVAFALVLVAAFFIVVPQAGERSHFIAVVAIGIFALLLAFTALGQNLEPKRVLYLTALSAIFKGAAIIYLAPETIAESLVYFLGITIGFAVALLALLRIPKPLLSVEYAGVAEMYPRATLWYFVGILWLTGFSLTPTFLGEDLLLHISAAKFSLATFFLVGGFVLNTVALFRSYVKLVFAR